MDDFFGFLGRTLDRAKSVGPLGLLGTPNRNVAGLKDLAHGVSRGMSADFLGAPVDLAAQLMTVPRYLGANTPNFAAAPFGGSASIGGAMEGLGLLRQQTGSMNETAGRFLGGILNSPQVVGKVGMLSENAVAKALQNAAIPNRMNPQTGAIVWHGSPHKFDKFDSSKIGTGEGAQAYGHGLYVAENPAVAKQYAGMNPASSVRIMRNGNKYDVVATRASGPLEELGTFATRADAEKAASAFTGSYHYKADLSDAAIPKMLDWDAPLSQQAPEVQAIARKRLEELRAMGGSIPKDPTGEWLHRAFGPQGIEKSPDGLFGQSAASVRLRDAGIPGIKYLDGGSRAAGEGSRNYVVFPGNEDLLKILERQ
jgi:hypothetical protein